MERIDFRVPVDRFEGLGQDQIVREDDLVVVTRFGLACAADGAGVLIVFAASAASIPASSPASLTMVCKGDMARAILPAAMFLELARIRVFVGGALGNPIERLAALDGDAIQVRAILRSHKWRVAARSR